MPYIYFYIYIYIYITLAKQSVEEEQKAFKQDTNLAKKGSPSRGRPLRMTPSISNMTVTNVSNSPYAKGHFLHISAIPVSTATMSLLDLQTTYCRF